MMKTSNQFLRYAVGAVIAVVLSVETTASAGETTGDGAPEEVIHFKQGIEFYKAGQFEEASIEFARAYELNPSYKLLYNIAQAENMLEHYARALSAYEQYLEEGGAEIPDLREVAVKKEIARLVYRVGALQIRYPEAGATVLVDGEARGKTPLEKPIRVSVGKREVAIAMNGETVFRQVFRIGGNQTVVVDLMDGGATTSEDTDGATPSETTPLPVQPITDGEADTGEGGNRRIRAVGFAAVGVGAAAAAAAVATGVISLSKKKDIDSGCGDDGQCERSLWEDEFNAVETLNITTDVLIGVAAVGVVTGVVLLLTHRKPKGESKVAVGAMPGRSGGMLSVSGSF